MADADVIRTRLKKLRKRMKEEGVDYFLIPTADYHLMEYIDAHFKVRDFFSGFSGSAGTLLVWSDGAGLWTDGRYFIMAEKQLQGSGITLFRQGEKDVPEIVDFLIQHLRNQNVLAMDGRVISARFLQNLQNRFCESNIVVQKRSDLTHVDTVAYTNLTSTETDTMVYADLISAKTDVIEYNDIFLPEVELSQGTDTKFTKRIVVIRTDLDPAEHIWTDRPDFDPQPIYVLPIEHSGEDSTEKLNRVRAFVRDQKADGMLLTQPDEIMWLLNLRGSDVAYNPVAYSYAYIQSDTVHFFAYKAACSCEVEAYLSSLDVTLHDYHKLASFLKELPQTEQTLVCPSDTNTALYEYISNPTILLASPIEKYKAIKNVVERQNIRDYYLRDSVAVTKFIYWLKKQMQPESAATLTQQDAANYLESLRRQIPGYTQPSFPTICAYQENAAQIHYETPKDDSCYLRPQGFLLVDSGGQYMGATTDVTRTISLGELTNMQRYLYTLVSEGMLTLSQAVFPQGVVGRNLDAIARMPLWREMLDYRHGTGHGVGCMLNVHEGPQSIRWKGSTDEAQRLAQEEQLCEGMLVSNEPGYYEPGCYGIRIENILLVKAVGESAYGSYLGFETLTYVPLERDAIDYERLTQEHQKLFDQYQVQVYERLHPFLTEEERRWLWEVTRPLGTVKFKLIMRQNEKNMKPNET